MLFGSPKDTPVTNGAPAVVFDVTTESFENDVIAASMETPVVVDFWAPWCGPCKQLGPALESAVAATSGKVRMAKVNVDDNQDLAQAMRVQSIPAVFVFFQGKPVTAFTGAKPASEIKMLMDQLAKMGAQAKPAAINIPETLSLAAKTLAAGDIMGAQGLYGQVMGQDENNAAAYAGLIRTFIALPDLEQAQFMIDDAPESVAKHADFAAAKIAMNLAIRAPHAGDLERMAKAVAANPADHQGRFDYAVALFAAGDKAIAIDQLIDIMQRDKASTPKWGDDKARLQLLTFFDAMGPLDPETVTGRRKLSTLLFS